MICGFRKSDQEFEVGTMFAARPFCADRAAATPLLWAKPSARSPQRSPTLASYAARIPVKTLHDKLTASGTFALHLPDVQATRIQVSLRP